jgi:class 3 adenylate cyclase/pimeloyl-ACP methyl ester carboxylesterase
MAEPSERRLAAIMFTDLVGYTSLTERDEGRAARARDRHRSLLRPLVEQFEGELLETPGDESLSVFPSALLAVDCALAVQAALRDDPELRLRIGIHLGDVLRRGGELIGEGVNLAARIRPLAEPGGVCVSDAVWCQVRGRAHLSARSLGPQRLKNVSEAIVVHALGTARRRSALRWRRRWPVWIAAGVALLGALGYANRAPLIAAVVLWAPKVLATPLPQDLGFATTSDGVRIAYATTGKGPPLVYVVGWGTHIEDGITSPLYDAEDLLPMTSRRHFFVRYDGRGFGLSDRNVTDFSLDARVRDLEAVVDALRLARFGIYAVSSGGPQAIAYTARHPERVTRLVLASTMASMAYLGAEFTREFERVLDLVEVDWHSRAIPLLFAGTIFEDQLDEVGLRVISEFLRRSAEGPAIAGFMRAKLEIDVSEEARRISVPTLVIQARDDRTVFPEAGRQLASLIPGARLEVVEGSHLEGIGSTAATRARILEYFAEDTTDRLEGGSAEPASPRSQGSPRATSPPD